MSDAVADAGPFIHLGEIGAERALAIFGTGHVPRAVAQELLARPTGPGASLLRLRNVKAMPLTAVQQRHAEQLRRSMSLSTADCTALALAHARKFVLLTDDLDLRDAAKALGVLPVGSVGVLIRASTIGILAKEEAMKALDALLDRSSLFITRPLLERAKRAVSETYSSGRSSNT